MTESTWTKTLLLLEENERRLITMPPSAPLPGAKFWRESAHGTLGHLTACQSAWLPYMRQLKAGASKGSIPIRPDPLYRKAGFDKKPWKELLAQFQADRAEWRSILQSIDPTRELKSPHRTLSAQSLTKRMADHETSHLNQLSS